MRSSRAEAVRLAAAVAAGSALGALARFALGLGLGPIWGTLAANVAGAFLIGFYAAASAPGGRLAAGPVVRGFVTTGFCGGFTTFSIFSLEALMLAEAAGAPLAAGFVLGSGMLWIAAASVGHRAGAADDREP